MAKTIVGVFDDATAAQSVVRELQGAGIRKEHIQLTSNPQVAEGSSASSADGSWKDKVLGFFESMFDDDDDRKHAHHYAEAWRRGHYLVIADVEAAQVDRTVEIMNRFGTVDLNRRTEDWRRSGYTGSYDRNARPYTAEERSRELAAYGKGQGETIPVVQEELAVGKQLVQRGGVRIHSYVKERPVEEIVRLREERVNVERRPANRAAEGSDLAFQERTIDVTAQSEQAVVDKRARVVEEVVVGKDVSQREETVRDTVRRKDVDVERIAGSEPRTSGTSRSASGQPTTPRR